MLLLIRHWRVVGTELGRGALTHVVSITGVKGDPQPEKWKIILEDPDGRSVRELGSRRCARLIPNTGRAGRWQVPLKVQRSIRRN